MFKTACALALCVLAAACPSGAADNCQQDGTCVDCTAVCTRMQSCRVDYGQRAPPVGGDTQQARCEYECMTSDTISPQRQDCILAADPQDVAACQSHVVNCLGVDGGSP